MASEKWWECRKCGEKISRAYLRENPTTRCPECQEPDLALYGICGLLADWGGDATKQEEPA